MRLEARYGTLHNLSMTVVAIGIVGAAICILPATRQRADTVAERSALRDVRPAVDRHGLLWLARPCTLLNRQAQVVIDHDGIALGFGRNRRFAWDEVQWVRLRRLGFRPQLQVGLLPAAFVAAISGSRCGTSTTGCADPRRTGCRDGARQWLDKTASAMLDAVRSFRPNLVRA